MAINPNSAFTRIYLDFPTPAAIKLDEHCRVIGKSKKAFIVELVERELSPTPPPAAAKKKGR